MAEKTYLRLTRARRRRSGFVTAMTKRSSLWLGADHLLNVDFTSFSEEYKRFYFRDIQAITIRVTRRRSWWNLALCMMLLLETGLLFRAGSTLVTGLIAVLIFVLPLIVNNLLGPTCATYLRTAVQTEELPSLSRVRRAYRVLARIRPLISAVQGQLDPEDVSTRMQEETEPGPVVTGPLNLS